MINRILMPALFVLLMSSARPQSVQWTRTFSLTPPSTLWSVKAFDVAALTSNSIYVVGSFHRTVNFGNGYTLTANNYNGGTHMDGFLLKMNQNGVVEWAKNIANEDQWGYGLHVDAFNGSLYVGTFDYDGTDPYVITEKYDSNGTSTWQNSVGDDLKSIYVDQSGNFYVLYRSASNYNVRKYAPSGATTTRTVSNAFEVEDLVADNVGNMYAVGIANSGNPSSVEIKKINSAGTALWSGTYPSSYAAFGYKMDIDDSANIYIQGRFSRNFTLGGYSLSTGTSSTTVTKGFIAKMDSSKNFKWVKLINDTINVHVPSFGGTKTMDVHVADDGQRVFAVYGDTLYTYSIATGNLEGTVSLGTARYFGFDESPDGSIYLAGFQGQTAYVTKISFDTSYSISGQVLTETGIPISGASVLLSGNDTLTETTDTTGRYSFTVTPGGSYTITPSKTNDVVTSNGISTSDVLLMRRHTLSIAPLPSPYKVIAAAEVNADGDTTVSTLDILRTRELILGNSTSFPTNRLWQFVSSDYVFPDVSNPFPFPNIRTYTNITSSQTGQNFIGIKLGDVNDSWDTSVP